LMNAQRSIMRFLVRHNTPFLQFGSLRFFGRWLGNRQIPAAMPIAFYKISPAWLPYWIA
jgi:hypothetical protein